MAKRICKIAECLNNAMGYGYCEKHYTRYRKYNDPLFTKYKMERWQRVQTIMSNIPQLSPDQCWEYQGRKESNGYGKQYGMWAHRVSYVYWHPTTTGIDQRYEVRHACDNPPCCNPYHLILGTRQDNVNDMINRQRGSVGQHRWNARLTESDIPAIRADKRPHPEIAADYGVHRRTITDVKLGKTWKHVA